MGTRHENLFATEKNAGRIGDPTGRNVEPRGIENHKHPNFEWEREGRVVDSFVL